ncbi:hypothetical protein BaRGS_00005261 [Batillaria attramentaria]|uniref:Uncharacterized protein n=1 Tax=Batillaria attramentaria TaxID=370345 RepID=A0ABD0LVZ8_9CAEN
MSFRILKHLAELMIISVGTCLGRICQSIWTADGILSFPQDRMHLSRQKRKELSLSPKPMCSPILPVVQKCAKGAGTVPCYIYVLVQFLLLLSFLRQRGTVCPAISMS